MVVVCEVMVLLVICSSINFLIEPPNFVTAKEAFRQIFLVERREMAADPIAPVPAPLFEDIIMQKYVNKRYLELMGAWMATQEQQVCIDTVSVWLFSNQCLAWA